MQVKFVSNKAVTRRFLLLEILESGLELTGEDYLISTALKRSTVSLNFRAGIVQSDWLVCRAMTVYAFCTDDPARE